MPKISVIMPVYNGEKYLREAIDSILNQTYEGFEFIIINDCSTDLTEEIIKSYNDSRIIYIKNEKNLGVALSLNKGLDLAQGEYIARMDADDISLPERFAEQVSFLREHPSVAVCGTVTALFGAKNASSTYTVFGKENIKIELLFSSCLAHPAVMMRRDVIKKEHYRYDNFYDKIEDYELWTRINEKYDMDNIDKVLFKYRIHEDQVTQNYTEKHIKKLKLVKKRQLDNLNIKYTKEEEQAFLDFCIRKIDYTQEYGSLIYLFDKIYMNNRQMKKYNNRLLKSYLGGIIIGAVDKQKKYSLLSVVFRSKTVSGIQAVKYVMKRILYRGKG